MEKTSRKINEVKERKSRELTEATDIYADHLFLSLFNRQPIGEKRRNDRAVVSLDENPKVLESEARLAASGKY